MKRYTEQMAKIDSLRAERVWLREQLARADGTLEHFRAENMLLREMKEKLERENDGLTDIVAKNGKADNVPIAITFAAITVAMAMGIGTGIGIGIGI
jgi:hypothetical protein